MPVAVSVNVPADKNPFCRGRLLHLDEDATLLSVLRVALGDNESLIYALRFQLQRPDEAGEDRRHVRFFHVIVENDQADRARAEEALDSGLELVTRTWRT